MNEFHANYSVTHVFFPSWYKFLVNLLLNKGTNLINHRRATTTPCLTVNMNKLILFQETDAREFILICQLSSYSTCKTNGKNVVRTHASFFSSSYAFKCFSGLNSFQIPPRLHMFWSDNDLFPKITLERNETIHAQMRVHSCARQWPTFCHFHLKNWKIETTWSRS